MTKRNPKVDVYIHKVNPFAKPILKKLRTLIHKTCPQVSEEIKWGAPFYMYQNRVLCASMGFKAHCALIFWKSALIKKKLGKTAVADMKRLRRITSLEELPSQQKLVEYIKLGMHFNEPTTKLPPREKRTIAVKTPADLSASLRANPKAQMTFETFTPSKRKDYIFWITAAKTPETRETRIKTAINWMAQGKPRNWKYELKTRSSKRTGK